MKRVKNVKKLIALLLTLVMVFSVTSSAIAGETAKTRDATIYDALEILKQLVDIQPNNAASLTGKPAGELTIFDALDILKGLVSMTGPVKVNLGSEPNPNPNPNPDPNPKPNPIVYGDFIPAAADLTVDIFQRAYEAKSGENNLVSPLSALLALSMTANGADGATLSEMEEVLGRGLTIDELNESLSAYVGALPSFEGSKLSIANSIWHKDIFPVNPAFLQTNRDYYNAEIIPSAFNAAAVKDINDWVNEKTDEMIPSIINNINPEAIMFLINAIAFDSAWEETYDESQVWESNFRALDGSVQKADMMYSNEKLFLSDGNATGFVKPYKDGAYSFAALLPNADVNIDDYIAGLTGESLMNTLNGAAEEAEEVRTALPKFSYDFDIKMNDMLKAMGMNSAFSEFADFSKINGDVQICISEVLHKTFIEVDEKGTKAAAVTSVGLETCSIPTYKTVYLNRPFVYVIIDNENNLPIFIGALTEIPD